jgi:hypothetical protein
MAVANGVLNNPGDAVTMPTDVAIVFGVGGTYPSPATLVFQVSGDNGRTWSTLTATRYSDSSNSQDTGITLAANQNFMWEANTPGQSQIKVTLSSGTPGGQIYVYGFPQQQPLGGTSNAGGGGGGGGGGRGVGPFQSLAAVTVAATGNSVAVGSVRNNWSVQLILSGTITALDVSFQTSGDGGTTWNTQGSHMTQTSSQTYEFNGITANRYRLVVNTITGGGSVSDKTLAY